MTPRTAAPETESWDSFWAEVSTGRTETIRGVQVRVPTDLPLVLQQRLGELRESSAEDDIAELVSLLFGDDIYGEWKASGIGLLELQTVLAWGIAQATGRDLTFRDAYEMVQAGDEGKPPAPTGANRAARRAQSKSTGGPSKRISSASTASARRTSRG